MRQGVKYGLLAIVATGAILFGANNLNRINRKTSEQSYNSESISEEQLKGIVIVNKNTKEEQELVPGEYEIWTQGEKREYLGSAEIGRIGSITSPLKRKTLGGDIYPPYSEKIDGDEKFSRYRIGGGTFYIYTEDEESCSPLGMIKFDDYNLLFIQRR